MKDKEYNYHVNQLAEKIFLMSSSQWISTPQHRFDDKDTMKRIALFSKVLANEFYAADIEQASKPKEK